MHHSSLASPMLAPSIARSGGLGLEAKRWSTIAPRDAGKRTLDIAGALALILALSPLLLLLVAMLKVTSGAVLYRHPRVGRQGRTFDCLKLRTMHVDSKRILDELLRDNPAARQEWLLNRKLRNDPRVTQIGRFLRSTSLDELPQLFNVLRGDMSLVGPRPVVASELVEHYGTDGTVIYQSVRPGLTGLWQISGRSDTSYRQRIELDARYVRERSLALDIKILLRTPIAVLRRDGAR